MSRMAVSPLFKIQIEQDIKRCEGQQVINGSEGLYIEVVNRYSKLITGFMQNLPSFRKAPLYACGPDYRPELRLIASKLRTYLRTHEERENEMANNPMKEKVDEFIQRGTDIGRMEFHPAGNGFAFSYVAGPSFDVWMNEIHIFNERYLTEHPLHESIASTYLHYRKDSSSHEKMMGYLRTLSADTEFYSTHAIQPEFVKGSGIMSNKVFIVHGHDDAAKQEMARTLEKAGFEAIILHEQPDKGRTIIEKIEDYADVKYAVILYTECDLGRDRNDPPASEQYRARQNVVFEHGFFIGKLGRDHVYAFVKGKIELPGDMDGVIYKPMDSAGAWKMELAKEMKAVGLPVDMNKFL